MLNDLPEEKLLLNFKLLGIYLLSEDSFQDNELHPTYGKSHYSRVGRSLVISNLQQKQGSNTGGQNI